MNILILGSGGREHTFAWKIAQSPKCSKLFVAPGNAGTSQIATNLNIGVNDFDALAAAVKQYAIDIMIVGPEEPLVRGVVDYFKKDLSLQHIKIVGPDASGARLEGSKDFSKAFMQKYNIPAGASQTFQLENFDEGLNYLEKQSLPIVLKADGLAAGKGVIIAESYEEAKQAFHEMIAEAKFGEASSKVLVEQYLSGIELSVFVLTDGKNYKILPEAKDYKRIGVGDKGLNTGGMGAVSPVPFADANFIKKVEEKIVKPTLNGLINEGIHYVGFIFIGLMNVEGEPYVIEYNARMGDPETEVVFPRIKNDLLELMEATADGTLDAIELDVADNYAITTVSVAAGYPEDYRKGDVMTIPSALQDTVIFHAGTKLNADNQIVTNGGRVITCTGLGLTLEEARQKSQEMAAQIAFEGKYFRNDIGKDLLAFVE